MTETVQKLNDLESARENIALLEIKNDKHLLQQQRRWGWFFLSPWIFGFFAFTFIPLGASLIFTFLNFKLTEPENITFAGLDNYRKLLRDPDVRTSLWVTIRFALVAVPLSIIIPVGMAALLNAKHLWGKSIFRTLFYMPYMVPAVSSVFIWQSFMNSETGLFNKLLAEIGVNGPRWLNDPWWIYPALFLIGIWGVGNAMLITLASMQNVPTELYDAAKVDGAGPTLIFYKITLPMISPVIFYNLILTVIGLMQYFLVPYILKGGRIQSGDPVYFLNLHLYKTTFTVNQDLGYGSTLAWLIFIISLAFTLLIFRSSRRWVYYAAES